MGTCATCDLSFRCPKHGNSFTREPWGATCAWYRPDPVERAVQFNIELAIQSKQERHKEWRRRMLSPVRAALALLRRAQPTNDETRGDVR